MKSLSSLFLMIMFSFSVVIAANMPDPTSSELQNEITVDETIKTFIKGLCENLTLDDYIHHESAVEALMRCCQRLEHNANSLPLQDLILAYPLLLARYQVLVNELPNDDTLKAPREEQRPFIVGPGACDLSSIRNLLNVILTNLNQCCQQIENNFITTFSILNDVLLTISIFSSEILIETVSTFISTVSILTELVDTLTVVIEENFQGTFTALNACCQNITSEFQQTWTILADGFDGTFTALNACCNNITSEFQQTWTILADGFDGTFSAIASIDLSFVFTELNAITACFATSLTAPVTITQSGYYCLANDVSGSFVITANDVTLDLNAHTITTGGVTVGSGIVGTTIKNGTITNSSVGIVLNNTTNSTIEDISITESPGLTAISSTGNGNRFFNIYIDTVAQGFFSDGDNYLLMDGVTVANTTGIGMLFSFLIDSTIKNVYIANTGSFGMELAGGCLYTEISNVSITDASVYGVYLNAEGGQQFGMDLVNISVSNMITGGTLAGIYATDAITFRFISCDVQDCDGNAFVCFRVDAGQNCLFDSCLAASNGAGTNTAGFQLACMGSVVQNCQALGLSSRLTNAVGFISSGVDNLFKNCVASNISVSPTGDDAGNAVGFETTANDNIFIDCQAIQILQTADEIGNFAYGYVVDADNVSLYNCVADQCNGSVINDSSSFAIFTGVTDTLLANCSATNSNGTGFLVQGTKTACENCIASHNEVGFSIQNGEFTGQYSSALYNVTDGFDLVGNSQTFIGCSASQNGGTGFGIISGQNYSFTDCNATLNNIGFNAPSPTFFLFPVNCVATNNGTDQINFPNFGGFGVAGPTTIGQNIES